MGRHRVRSQEDNRDHKNSYSTKRASAVVTRHGAYYGLRSAKRIWVLCDQLPRFGFHRKALVPRQDGFQKTVTGKNGGACRSAAEYETRWGSKINHAGFAVDCMLIVCMIGGELEGRS